MHTVCNTAYNTRAAPKTANSAPRHIVCTAGKDAVAIPPDAGGAAPAVGDELPEADPVAEPLADPLADSDDADTAARDERAEDPDDALLLLAEADVAEGVPVADDEVTPAPPVELAERASELEGEGWSMKATVILISEHWSPMDSS